MAHEPLKPLGRPSEYKPEFDAQAYDCMAAGYSKTATAGYLGICKQTLHNWCAAHPSFLDAVKQGEAARTLKLEGDLLSAPDGPTVTSRIFALKNAAPDEWRDKRDVELSGPDGGPVRIAAEKLSAEAMREILAASDATPEPDEG